MAVENSIIKSWFVQCQVMAFCFEFEKDGKCLFIYDRERLGAVNLGPYRADMDVK